MQETNRQKKIKRIAAVFFAVLLTLTIFSNTILNYMLPEVSSAVVRSEKVADKITGSGVVCASQEELVKVSGDRTIEKIMVKVGDTVTAGQSLFYFEEEISSENTLQSEEDTLKDLQMQYKKSALNTAPEYENEDLQITYAREDLQAAKQAVKKAKKNASLKKKWQKELKQAKDEEEKKQNQVDSLNDSLELLEEEGNIDQSQTETTQTAASYSSRRSALNAQLKEATKELSKASSKVSGIQEKVDFYSGKQTVEEAKSNQQEKERALEQLCTQLKTQKKLDDKEQQVNQLDKNALQEQVEQQEEKIKKLLEEDDSVTCKAKMSGVVIALNCAVGEKITPDTTLAVIQPKENSYTLSFQVDKSQSEKIAVGDAADSSDMWNGEAAGEVLRIDADSENPDIMDVVTLQISGNVKLNENRTFTVGGKTLSNETVVPNSAIREDSQGDFVYKLMAKSTPFGNRYYVQRTSVTVEASDEENSAVVGELMQEEYVITNCSAVLEDGNSVRLKEE